MENFLVLSYAVLGEMDGSDSSKVESGLALFFIGGNVGNRTSEVDDILSEDAPSFRPSKSELRRCF
jgi:hypothetical protein